ncbi:Alcohol dehydrogenase, putative [Penicillium digitatum PHI26]|uniref:Alcohol dehydrogenase, putative n=2 Tax=Penicillium digitatum TaxID=36651 RepID=K9FR51_PEND2|nr:Alcohol dehydrogenase, putative [Penicillium digitatum Pd1]EKV10809.1 Alcohol dehydrogenase, putative [Penicillium digitatum Pd1]EKV11659.1 Alcohol dehydrogenase, putative [Penicillium digitatum PHI26]
MGGDEVVGRVIKLGADTESSNQVGLSDRRRGQRAIDVVHGSKEKLVKESGADLFVDKTQFLRDDNGAALRKHVHLLTGKLKTYAAVVRTAVNAAYAQALPLLRLSGTVVCVRIPKNDPQAIATAFPSTMILKQWSITGSVVRSRKEAIETVDFTARGVVTVHCGTEKMDALTEVFNETEEGKIQRWILLSLSG